MGGITRLNQLPDGSGLLSNDDIFLMMDDPSGSAVTKKVSLSQLGAAIGSSSSFQVGNIDLHNGGVQSAQLLQFNDNTQQSVITGPTPPSGDSARRIIIQGQRAVDNGEGGDVYLWGGDSDVNGGDIKIYAGDADNVAPNNGYGGYVNIDGGKGASFGGNVEITGGYSEGGQAGHVYIVGGPTSSGVAGNVVVRTSNNNQNWTFGSNGRLTLPNGNLIESQAGQGETNIQIIDNTSPFKIYTHASVNAKGWIYDADGDLTIPGNILLSNGTSLASGTFDNSTGGQNGISLNCAVGYELNWQGGRLRSTADGGVSSANIYIDSPITYSPVTSEIIFDTTINTNASSGEIFDITLTDNTTIANPTNPTNGKTIRWRISQDGVGGRTVALGNKFNIPSSATSPLPWSTGVNKMDILAATYHSGRDKWDIVAFVPGY
ncbi:hypothetical protein EB001_06170 [bacterium]|nr:hypothetical protein [bacterium]